MRFSYVMLPDYPLAESLEAIRLADELGFHAVYAADETWHRDLWLLFAAAAGQTSRVRFGPSVSPVTLREPTLIAQAVMTLDELSGGRAEAVVGSGNFGLLAQYNIDWKGTKPLSRVTESVQVMRTFIDNSAITFDGEFFSYNGLFTFARPVQEHLPLKIGAMRGPRSFQAAAEFADGCHHALGYTPEAYRYMYDNMKVGAERAGKNVDDLDIGAWMVFAVGEDGEIAKQAARSMVGIYASSMPTELLERNGVTADDMAPVNAALGAGDLPGAYEATRPDVAEKLSVAGTPEEVTAKLKTLEPIGVNHMVLAITDAGLVKAFTGREIEGVADVNTQLRLVRDHVMPAFS